MMRGNGTRAAASDGHCPRRAFPVAQRGFSLLELMVVLSIVALLAALASPSLASLVRDNKVYSATSELHTALHLTRSEAITRGRRVTMCTSPDGLACEADIGWARGWIVFEDKNANGVREAEEVIVQVAAALPLGVLARGNAPVRDSVSYVPAGMTRAVGGALQMGRISVCSGDVVRRIVISAAGRPRVEKDAGPEGDAASDCV